MNRYHRLFNCDCRMTLIEGHLSSQIHTAVGDLLLRLVPWLGTLDFLANSNGELVRALAWSNTPQR